jgi:hypothetical protein
MDKSFLSDIKELRRRARSHIEEGPVTLGKDERHGSHS